MTEKKKISEEFRLKNIGETRNCFIEKMSQNKLMIKKQKNVCRVLNYVEHLIVSNSAVTGCVYISAFASLDGILLSVTRSTVGLKLCVITAGIKKCKSIIQKKEKELDKIVLLAKSKLNSIEVLISKTLIDSNISYDEFISINNVLKEETKNLKT